MSNNDNFEFKSPYETKYGGDDTAYTASDVKSNDFQTNDAQVNDSEEFLSPYEILVNRQNANLYTSNQESPVERYLEKIIPSVAVGASVAPFTAAGSAAYQSGKYGLQRAPSVSTALRMAGPALDVLKGRPPADLMQRASQIVSTPAFDRGIQGGMDELSGTTGIARQEMYRTEQSRRADLRKGKNTPLTQGTWGATNTGILVPSGNQPPKPVGGLSSIFSPQTIQAAKEVKDFASAVVPKAAARGMGGFGLGFSGAETLRTGAEAAKDTSAIPEFVLNTMGTLGGLGMFIPGAAPIAAPFAFGAPALASAIGMAREGSKREAQKNIPAKERFLAMPETTPGERGLPINARPAMSRQELGYRDARKGALYFAEP